MMDKLWTLFVRDARLAMTYRFAFFLSWLAIPITVVSLAFISKIIPPSTRFGVSGVSATYFDFAVVNVAFLTLQTAALQSFDRSIRDGQMFGTLEAMLATPTSEELIVVGSALWSIALAVAQVAWYLAIGAALGLRLHHVDIPALFLFAALSISSTAPLGILSAAFVMTFKQGAPTTFLVNGAASLAGGVLVPIAVLPNWLQIASWCLPIAHALNGVRGAMHGASLANLSYDALWLAIESAVLFPVARFAFRAATKRARYDGTLGQY